MNTLIVTEGESDIIILRTLLEDITSTVQFAKSGGWSAADSLARSYLIDGQYDVALVVDADTYDKQAIEERRQYLTHSLGSVALRNRWQVTVIAPEIEVLFFRDRPSLEHILQKPISDSLFEQGKFEPKKVLAKLFPGQSRLEFLSRLVKSDLTALRNQEEILSLRRFLKGTPKRVAA